MQMWGEVSWERHGCSYKVVLSLFPFDSTELIFANCMKSWPILLWAAWFSNVHISPLHTLEKVYFYLENKHLNVWGFMFHILKYYSYFHTLLNFSHWIACCLRGWDTWLRITEQNSWGGMWRDATGIFVKCLLGCCIRHICTPVHGTSGSWGPWCLYIAWYWCSRDPAVPLGLINVNQSFYVFISSHLCSFSSKGTNSV